MCPAVTNTATHSALAQYSIARVLSCQFWPIRPRCTQSATPVGLDDPCAAVLRSLARSAPAASTARRHGALCGTRRYRGDTLPRHACWRPPACPVCGAEQNASAGHVLTTMAMHVLRLGARLADTPRASTRRSLFAALPTEPLPPISPAALLPLLDGTPRKMAYWD